MKTADEFSEISRYNQAKLNLQKNLLGLWTDRLQEVKSFQKRKAKKEALQSQYFRDNFSVKTELKKIAILIQTNKNNRSMFIEFWKSAVKMNALFKKIAHLLKLKKKCFKRKKDEIKSIVFSLSKMRKMNSDSRIFDISFAKEIFIGKVKIYRCFKIDVTLNIAKKNVAAFFKKILVRENFCEAFDKYDTSCRIISFES